MPRGRVQARRLLGYLPQHPGAHPGFTAFEFVDYVAILKELTDRLARHAEVRRVLDAVGLAEQRGRRIRALSGGMRQRVALAAALVGDPGFLVLDEPTVGLDPEQRMRFRELIAEAGEGRTVLLSTHQTEDVAMLCRRVVVLDRGRVRFDGTPGELSARAERRVCSCRWLWRRPRCCPTSSRCSCRWARTGGNGRTGPGSCCWPCPSPRGSPVAGSRGVPGGGGDTAGDDVSPYRSGVRTRSAGERLGRAVESRWSCYARHGPPVPPQAAPRLASQGCERPTPTPP
ncbi:ATP-binding cassette domain-containing protein, partial [Streptomyces sp. 8K308]